MADIDKLKLRQLDFTLLLVLRALLRHRRATAAAAELGLSQSAVSHALARLRRLFGDPLFLRLPHGLEPTRHALDLAPRIEALLLDAAAAMGLAESFDPATSRRGFRIAAADHVGALLAAPLLQALDQTARGVRFALRVALGAEALERLRRDEIDLAIGQFQRSLEGYEALHLYTDRYCVVARRAHPRLEGRRLTRALFEELGHVAISVGGDFRSFMDEGIRDVGLTRRIVVAVPRFSTALEVVRRTDSIALAPAQYARAHAPDLAMHEFPGDLPPMRIMAVRRAAPDPGLDWLQATIAAILPSPVREPQLPQ